MTIELKRLKTKYETLNREDLPIKQVLFDYADEIIVYLNEIYPIRVSLTLKEKISLIEMLNEIYNLDIEQLTPQNKTQLKFDL